MAVKKGTLTLRYDLKELVNESPMETVDFIGDIILPGIPVKETSAQMPVLPTGAGMKLLDLKRGPRGTFKRGQWVWSDSAYYTYEFGYEEPIDNVEKLKNADIFNEEVVAAQIARSQMLIVREKRVSDTVYNAATFTGATNTLSITTEWSNIACTPYADVTAAHAKLFAKCGKPRSQLELLINDKIFRNVMRATEVRADVKYTVAVDKLNASQKASYLAEYLGIRKVHVATSFYDSSLVGIEDATFSQLWSDEYAMLFYPAPKLASWKIPGLGRQPIWTKFSPDYRMESYDEDQTDSRIVRVREYRGTYIDTKYGFLLSNMTA